MTDKAELKKRFAEKFPNMRLLAVQLNGFSHSIFCDFGSKTDRVKIMEYSEYTGDGGDLKAIFQGFPHYAYQHNAKEYVYVAPDKR